MNVQDLEIANGMVEGGVAVASSDNKMLLAELREMKHKGDVSSPEFIRKMKQLEVMLGISQISPFGTNELSVFEDRLSDMSKTDMERMAQKIGISPLHQRGDLKKALLKEFSYYSRGTSRNIMPEMTDSFVIDPSNPKHQELLRAMGN